MNAMMSHRKKHLQEVSLFLQEHLSIRDAIFSLPPGSGMETYFVQGNGREYFVKVGASIERYLAMADLGLTTQVLAFGQLKGGSSILVQHRVAGKKPSRADFREHLERVARMFHTMHHHPRVRETLQPAFHTLHKEAGFQALNALRQKWEIYRTQVPDVADFIDSSLEILTRQVGLFSTEGLVSSHGDICNANWIFASDASIYIVDLESMSMDDPAFDMGALLWWYYPPELRQHFLEIAGYPYDCNFRLRMRVRMGILCLNILLPREGCFDQFDPRKFSASLKDFRAILNGDENPQGYDTG